MYQVPIPPVPPSPDVFIGQDAQVRELTATRHILESSRHTVESEAKQTAANSAARAQLDAQVAQIDQRIATIDQMIAGIQAVPPSDLAQLVGVPPYVPERALPKDIFVLSGVFIVCVLFPLAVAVSLRILRRGARRVAALPAEFADRLGRMESVIEATAIEVERIGEGQRYLTRVLGDRKADELLERPRPVAPYRIITPH